MASYPMPTTKDRSGLRPLARIAATKLDSRVRMGVPTRISRRAASIAARAARTCSVHAAVVGRASNTSDTSPVARSRSPYRLCTKQPPTSDSVACDS